MKVWFRWLLLVLTIGGGFMGLAIAVQAMFAQDASGFFYYLFCCVAIGLYCFVIVSGLLFAENSRCITPMRVGFALQVPWVSSPILVYGFGVGCRITTGLGLLDGRFSATFRFGSDFDLFIFGHHPWFVGINVFAVLMLVSLAVYGRRLNIAGANTDCLLNLWTH